MGLFGRKRSNSALQVQIPKPRTYRLPSIKTSSSMPEIAHSLGIAIDDSIPVVELPAPPLPFYPDRAPVQYSMKDDHGFHKPSSASIRTPSIRGKDHPVNAPTIAELYSQQTFVSNEKPFKRNSLPTVRRLLRAPPTFTLCVVGASDTGKTTFLKTLLMSLALARSSDASEFLAQVASFGAGKHTNGYESLSVDVLLGSQERVTLTVIDTPGWDRSSSSSAELQVDAIRMHCENAFDVTFEQERQVLRKPSRTDSHIHCCLYFYHPDDLRKSSSLHTRLVRKLSKRANVFPVIARSDTCTTAQLNSFKLSMREQLSQAGLWPSLFKSSLPSPLPDLDLDPTSEGDLNSVSRSSKKGPLIRLRSKSKSRNSVISQKDASPPPSPFTLDSVLPFAIATPEDLHVGQDMRENGPRFTRSFTWGQLDIANPAHTDFTALQSLILETQWKHLKELTQEKYEEFRTQRLIRSSRQSMRPPTTEQQRILLDIECL